MKSAAPTRYFCLRLTIPAREVLVRAGNQVRPMSRWLGVPLYEITLVAPPAGLVLVLIGHGDEQHYGIRLPEEPAYPGEWRDVDIAWGERGSWTATSPGMSAARASDEG